jgi:hypothetical protein
VTTAADPIELLKRQLRSAELLLQAINRDSGTREEVREAIESYFRAKKW